MALDYAIDKGNLLECVVSIFLTNKRKGNMLHSCILALFELIATPQQLHEKTFDKLVNKIRKNEYDSRVFQH
jgi:endonuclease III